MEFTCMICGTVFERPRRGGPYPETCPSDQCRRKRRAQSVVEYRWRSRGGSTTQTRVCNECGNSFEFVRTQGMKGRGPGFCSEECRRSSHLRSAREKRATHWDALPVEERARRRRVALLAQYSLTPERYDKMRAAQGDVCAICGLADTKHHSPLLKIDHDRSCCPGNKSCGKCVRGLLCSNCNRAIGLFGDDPTVIQRAIDYLKEDHMVDHRTREMVS